MGMQTGLDIPQAVSASELCKGHGKVLIPAGEVADPVVALMPVDALVERSRSAAGRTAHRPVSS